ncbi:zinc transporter permease subunit ZevB, partial [Neisseria meningitidis]|nr:zinc transporter permease subunit ZevB [Neisseria meningitidis]
MKKYKTGLVLVVIALALLVYVSPWFFLHIAAWQKDSNQLIWESLHQIQNNSIKAGNTRSFVSLVYRALHDLGPGHRKSIIGSSLPPQQIQLEPTTHLVV